LLDRVRDWDRRTADRVTHFAAVSRTVADRIQECYGRPSEVVHPPVDTDFYSPDDAPRDDFYLCAGALVPYKRIDLAVEACNILGRRLVVIGDGPERRRLERLAGPTVKLLGWQPDEVIREHYRRCRALLFPGREDFGIVPVEALACGAAVIAFGEGGATETVTHATSSSKGTGLFFAEQTTSALCDAIRQAEACPAGFCPALARDGALRFSASRFEREIVALLERVVAQARTSPRRDGLTASPA
jgi:glycosyltransferase involved in cell wall biosynthesis